MPMPMVGIRVMRVAVRQQRGKQRRRYPGSAGVHLHESPTFCPVTARVVLDIDAMSWFVIQSS